MGTESTLPAPKMGSMLQYDAPPFIPKGSKVTADASMQKQDGPPGLQVPSNYVEREYPQHDDLEVRIVVQILCFKGRWPRSFCLLFSLALALAAAAGGSCLG
jgi:hypothetical protein